MDKDMVLNAIEVISLKVPPEDTPVKQGLRQASNSLENPSPKKQQVTLKVGKGLLKTLQWLVILCLALLFIEASIVWAISKLLLPS